MHILLIFTHTPLSAASLMPYVKQLIKQIVHTYENNSCVHSDIHQ